MWLLLVLGELLMQLVYNTVEQLVPPVADHVAGFETAIAAAIFGYAGTD